MKSSFTNFSSGEVAEEYHGRVDADFYRAGLSKCRNFTVDLSGSLSNRAGLKFIAPTRYYGRKSRVIKFQFNQEQTYILELGHLYMRIIKDGAQVLESAKTITGITQASQGVFTSALHGFIDGNDVFIEDEAGMVEVNGRFYRVSDATLNDFKLKDYLGNYLDTSTYTAFAGGAIVSRVYTLVTPYEEDDLFELHYAQSNDVITITHNNYFPRDITRTADDNWVISQFESNNGSFRNINITPTTVRASATTGSITLTSSAALFESSMEGELFYLEQEPDDSTAVWQTAIAKTTNDIVRAFNNYYKALNSKTTGDVVPTHIVGSQKDGDDGVQWQYLHSGFGIARITTVTSSTTALAEVTKTLPSLVVSGATTQWAQAAWSATQGYPATTAFYKQRQWFAGVPQKPNGVWASATGARNAFGIGGDVLDTDSIRTELDTVQQNIIRHLLPFRKLIALTSLNEHSIDGENGIIKASQPLNVQVEGYNGANGIMPLVIGNNALFVQDYGSEIYTLSYSYENSGGLLGAEITQLSQHLFRNKTVLDWDYSKYPQSIIWSVMDDGTLNGCTFRDKLVAWHSHSTDGEFESCSTVREGNETAAYFVVKREVDGNTVRYIERMASRVLDIPQHDATRIERFNALRSALFLDSAVSYDGRNTGAITLTLSGGTTWDSPETITATASNILFKSSDVGDKINIWISTGSGDSEEVSKLSLTITAFTSSTIVSVTPNRTIPSGYRSVAFTDWELARDRFFPLHHLEGEEVTVLADGSVVSATVTDGVITLDDHAAVVHAGLGYTSEIETLDINIAGTKAMLSTIPTVYIGLVNSVGGEVGAIAGFKQMESIRLRDSESGYDLPPLPASEMYDVTPSHEYSRKGKVCVRQSDPLPMCITSITPEIKGGRE